MTKNWADIYVTPDMVMAWFNEMIFDEDFDVVTYAAKFQAVTDPELDINWEELLTVSIKLEFVTIISKQFLITIKLGPDNF